MMKNFKWLFLVSLTFLACNKVAIDEKVTAGTANFSKFVALGDSFGAGYSDGALFIEGQKGAYPNVIAQQLVAAGGGTFTTPLMADNVGGLLLGGNVIEGPRLYFNGAAPVPAPGVPSTKVETKITGPFNNLGVPGAKSYYLLAPGYGSLAGVVAGSANPYYARFSTSATSTLLEDAASQSPTFFSLLIGGNDVLSYASSGGIGVNQTGNTNTATYGYYDITDPGVFTNVYNVIINRMTANGAKGVVANLPYVNTLPFFTTVPFNPLSTSALGGGNVAAGQATIDALNTQLYGPLKSVLTALGAGGRINLLSASAANPLLIKDESLPNLSAQLTAAFTPSLGAQNAAFYGAVFGQARQTTEKDLVLLTTQSVIGAAPTAANSGLGMVPPSPLDKFGITFPLQDAHVLIPSEIAAVKTATDAYNATIKSIADAKGLAFVDTKTIMDKISTTGMVVDNILMTSAYVTGGCFSLDGVHPSPRGYALIANAFIDAINSKYSSTIKKVDLRNYRTLFPGNL